MDATAPHRRPGRAFASIVVPCFDEEDVIEATCERLRAVLDAQDGLDYELVFVDDGSRDATRSILRGLAGSDPRVRVLGLSRNFGHQNALTAGLVRARGDLVVTIDADLQDPPELIPRMIEDWRGGSDVVYAVRTVRDGETRFKRWTASLFYRLINRLSDVSIPLDAGDFRLMDRRVVDALLAMPESNRFVRGMVAWVGYRQSMVPYGRAPRAAGVTKYPLFRMLRFAVDGVTSFSMVPLRLATWMGFIVSAIAAAGVLYAVVARLLTRAWVPGWAALFVAVSFLGGVQLIFLGILGEYVGRLYAEAKRRPLYIVEDAVGFREDGGAAADGPADIPSIGHRPAVDAARDRA